MTEVYAFDVATVHDDLVRQQGHRDISQPRWSRVVIASDKGLTDAHLAAAHMGTTRGLVIEVLYRD